MFSGVSPYLWIGCVFEIDRSRTEISDMLTITSKDDTSKLRHTLLAGAWKGAKELAVPKFPS